MLKKASLLLVLSFCLAAITAQPALAHSPHVDVSMAVNVTSQQRLGCVDWTATVNAPAGGFDFDFVDVEMHFPTFTEHGLQVSSESPWTCPEPPQTGQFEQGATPSDGNPATDDPHGQAGCTFQSAVPGVGPAILPAGGSVQCFFSTRVTADAPITNPPTLLFNHAHVSAQARPNSQGEDGVSQHDTNEVATAIVGIADLGVTKSGPASVNPGATVNYTIVVTNQAGRDPALNTVLSDSLPSNLTGVTVSGGGCTSFPCDLGTLNGGQSVTVQVSGTVSDCTDLSNTASASSDTPEPASDPTPNSSTANTNVVCTDLSVAKSAPSVSASGDSFNYSITVTNNGPDASTGGTVTDTLPAELTYNAAASSSECSESGGTVTCSVGALAVNGTQTFTINVTALGDERQVCNTASVDANENDPTSANDSSTACTNVGLHEAKVDVKENSINSPLSPKQGVVNVRLFSDQVISVTDIADANGQIKPGAQLCFGADPATTNPPRDPLGGDCTPASLQLIDQNKDGTPELLQAKFDTKDTNLVTGDTMACLAGETTTNVHFIGCDKVTTK